MARKQTVTIDDLSFNCLIEGKEENELIIFLHGFPESSAMWKPILKPIADQGFFCLAPTMRGYSENACPKGAKNYKMELLTADIIHLAQHFGRDKFHLVGHDFGAVIAWNLAAEHPDLLISLSALSVPHPRAFGKALKTDKLQAKKSSYIKWILLPYLPEFYLRWTNFAVFKKLYRGFDSELIDEYLSIFKNNKCLTGALNYYRENLGPGKGKKTAEVKVPTLFIWGNKDLAVGRTAAELCENYVQDSYKFIEIDGGHWLVQHHSDQILNHLKFLK